MKMEILIVTHAKDIPFLHYCVASIEKFAAGFSGVTLLVPRHEEDRFSWAKPFVSVRLFEEPVGKGMLAHEVQICRADEWCPSADTILHLDADCMFWRPCTPDDFMISGKPLLVRERYSDCWKSNPARCLWQTAVQRAMGFFPEWETMVRHPQVHLREVYPAVRAAVEWRRGVFDDYVLSGPNSYPQEFCEFGSLGAIAIRDFPDRYSFVDYDHDRDARECGVTKRFQYVYRINRDFCVEAWSHAGVDGYSKMFDDIMAGNAPEYYVKGE